MQNYYEKLGVSRYASVDEIKQATQQKIQLIKTAYATLSDADKRQAYDANRGEVDYYVLLDTDDMVTGTHLKAIAQEKLKEFEAIYKILSDSVKREEYDASLQASTSSAPPKPTISDDNPYAAPDTVVIDILGKNDEIKLASRGSRLKAYIIDTLIYMTPIIIVLVTATFLEDSEMASGFVEGMENGDFNSVSTFMPLYATFIALSFIVIFILNLIYLHRNGQTIGKKALNIKIVRTDYSRASLPRIIFLRYIVIGFLGGIPGIGVFITFADYLMIFGKERRCLHDYIADTIVVEAE